MTAEQLRFDNGIERHLAFRRHSLFAICHSPVTAASQHASKSPNRILTPLCIGAPTAQVSVMNASFIVLEN